MYSKNAAELAYVISHKEAHKVILLNVILRHFEKILHDQGGELLQKELSVSQNIVNELYELGQSYGVWVSTLVRESADLIRAVMDVVNEESVDLIILGINIRAGHERLYLGPRVENIMQKSPCPVIVLNT